MIANAQIPLHYYGYGIIILDMETFSKVRIASGFPKKKR